MSDVPLTCLPSAAPGKASAPPRSPHVLPHKLMLNRTSVGVAWVALALAAVHPPHGLGLPVCWLRATTGLPCWGCGLSRSLSCCLRGMFAEAWGYHPFGVVVVAVLFAIALGSVLPGPAREGVVRFLDRFPRAFNVAYALFVTSFLVYGLVRATWHLVIMWT